MKFVVQRDYIIKRNQRAKKYNAHNRSKEKFLRDIECEMYEYEMIRTGAWEDDERWQVDGISARFGTIDVKCISRFYNLSRQKLVYILQQRGHTDMFCFVEWKSRPNRILKTGDIIEFNQLGYIPYFELFKHLKVSFKGDGYYVDVRKVLENYGEYLLRDAV